MFKLETKITYIDENKEKTIHQVAYQGELTCEDIKDYIDMVLTASGFSWLTFKELDNK